MISSISITLDDGSEMFILARHKEVVQSVRALRHVLSLRLLDGELIYSTTLDTSRLLIDNAIRGNTDMQRKAYSVTDHNIFS